MFLRALALTTVILSAPAFAAKEAELLKQIEEGNSAELVEANDARDHLYLTLAKVATSNPILANNSSSVPLAAPEGMPFDHK